jgi:hypothetical protein
MLKYSILIIMIICLSSCSNLITENKSKDIQIIKGMDGNTTILDSDNKQLLIIGQSNRIIDVIDLQLTEEQISAIKTQKELNDNKVKVNYWNSFTPPKEKYSISFSTRYYKDQCLYRISISPWDTRLQQRGFKLVNLQLSDISGFTLEEVFLPTTDWTRVVDSNGVPTEFQLTGKIPMTLDNYMEVSDWSCTWNSNKQKTNKLKH